MDVVFRLAVEKKPKTVQLTREKSLMMVVVAVGNLVAEDEGAVGEEFVAGSGGGV